MMNKMKKAVIILSLVFLSIQSYAQAGDLYFGLQGGYATYFKAPVYGLNISYDILKPLQVSLTGLMNPKAPAVWKEYEKGRSLYTVDLDARLFLINLDSWATGPSIGAQYLHFKVDDNTLPFSDSAFGFNIGWHLRVNMSENLRLNGGWRYTTNKIQGYSLFYIGIGYAFNLF